jgi:hypothetical protein
MNFSFRSYGNADTLVADFDVVELLTRLADRCVDVLGVGAGGLMLVAPDSASPSQADVTSLRACS